MGRRIPRMPLDFKTEIRLMMKEVVEADGEGKTRVEFPAPDQKAARHLMFEWQAMRKSMRDNLGKVKVVEAVEGWRATIIDDKVVIYKIGAGTATEEQRDAFDALLGMIKISPEMIEKEHKTALQRGLEEVVGEYIAPELYEEDMRVCERCERYFRPRIGQRLCAVCRTDKEDSK